MPSLVAGVEILCEAGFIVDVFMPVDSEQSSSRLRYFVDSRSSIPAIVEAPITKPRAARLIPYALYEAIAGPLVRRHRRRVSVRSLAASGGAETPYVCLIGVDPEGLVEAQAWGSYFDTPYMYWSFEILIREELTSHHLRRLKNREVSANRSTFLALVQDKDRAALLAAENHIPEERIMYVPNGYRGSARRTKSYFAHELLGIPPSQTVVLAAGLVNPWAMTEQVVRSANDWPDGLVLVVHSRFDMRDNAYAQRVMAAADPRRVRFSTRPLSPDQYEALVDSADIGLALYQPQMQERYVQGNLRTLGLSSGKLAAFLRAGIPVIVSRLKGPADLVQEHQCGVIVGGPQELPGALGLVLRRYDEFADNAARAFDQALGVDRYFVPVLDALKNLARPS